MKQRSVLLLLLLASLVVSCSPGHLGSNVIAFVRSGHLWTIDPDGANAFQVDAETTPVVGYNWSPTHQLLAFRALDVDFAKTAAAQHLNSQPVTGQIGDTASTMNTVGVDGGMPIPVAFSSPIVYYSNAIWDNNGTRLLYRQTPPSPSGDATAFTWWVSQNDQPGGIAIKSLPGGYAIPSVSYLPQQYIALNSSSRGVFTTTLTGSNVTYRVPEMLPGHPLPASLERILWQPAHQDRSFLYAVAAPSTPSTSTPPQTQQTSHTPPAISTGALAATNASPPIVQLLLRTLSGQTTTLATCACRQFAWSPDGNYVLYSTASTYTIINVRNHTSFNIAATPDSVPYWSPNSRFLLLDGMHTLELLDVTTQQSKVLLSDGTADTIGSATTATTTLATSNARLQPVPNSIWATDNSHFLFLTRNRLAWQGQHIGKGLYTVTIDTSGRPQGSPVLVDTGNDTQAGWTYQDANTSFLY